MKKSRKIKKVLSVGLSLCVVVSMTAPLNVSAAAPKNAGNVTYTNKDFTNGVHTTASFIGKKLTVTNDGSETLKENVKNSTFNKAVSNGGADAKTNFNLLGNTDIGKAVFKSSGSVTSNSPKANLDDVVVKAADSTVQVAAPVDNVTAAKTADGATVKLKDDVSNFTMHAPSATASVGSNVSVDTVEVSETAKQSKIIVEKNATVTDTTVSAENTSVLSKPGSTLTSVTATEEASGSTVEVRGKAVTVSTEAPNSTVVAAKKAEVNSITAQETAAGATVSTAPKTTVGTATVSAPAANVEVSGTAKNVNATKTATGATVNIAQTATVDSTKNAAPASTVSISGTVTNSTTTKSATGANVSIAETAKVDNAKNAAPDSTVNISGSVTNVTNTKTATGAATTIAQTATVTTATNNAENSKTTVSGQVTNVVSGAANQTVTVTDTAKAENITVSQNADKATVTVAQGATVNTVTASSTNSTVTLNNTVDKVTVTDTAANTTITGTGKVDNAEVNADGTQILTQVSTVNVAEGVSDAKVYDITLSSGTTSVEHSTDEKGNTVISTATQATDGSKVDAVQTIVSTDEGYTATVETTKTDATGEVVETSTTNVVDNGETKDLNTSTTNVATGETTTSSSTGSSTSGMTNQVPIDPTPDDSTTTPGTGTETPGTGTETPGTGTETPGTGTETPGTGTETPGTGTETPSVTPTYTYYTVTFNANGGSAVSQQTVVSGNSITEPTAPTRSGYTFTGWYTDAALTTTFNFTTSITANRTLYAGWIATGSEAAVASVQTSGEATTLYASLQGAVNAATTGSTITLLSDIALGNSTVEFKGAKTITLAMAGHSITSNGVALLVGNKTDATEVTITGRGTIERSTSDGSVIELYSNSKLTLGGEYVNTSTERVAVQYSSNLSNANSDKQAAVAVHGGTDTTVLTVRTATITNTTYGITPFSTCTVNIENGALVQSTTKETGDPNAAISGNGSSGYGGTTINVTGGTVDGGASNVGIYQPQSGILTITGGKVTGIAGLDIKSGTVRITGGEVEGTGTGTTVYANKSGATALKGAVTVIEKAGYAGNVDVTIGSGATISGDVLNVRTSANTGKTYTVTNNGTTVAQQ